MPYAGVYAMVKKLKVQRKQVAEGQILIGLFHADDHDIAMRQGYFPAGTFMFDILCSFGHPQSALRLQDETGKEWRLDDRVWNSLTITHFHTISAEGINAIQTPVGGLSDLCLDLVANILLKATRSEKKTFLDAGSNSYYMVQRIPSSTSS